KPVTRSTKKKINTTQTEPGTSELSTNFSKPKKPRKPRQAKGKENVEQNAETSLRSLATSNIPDDDLQSDKYAEHYYQTPLEQTFVEDQQIRDRNTHSSFAATKYQHKVPNMRSSVSKVHSIGPEINSSFQRFNSYDEHQSDESSESESSEDEIVSSFNQYNTTYLNVQNANSY
ncbi:2937_t:CDS:2, partial [Gigaspora margarita]